ncbi:hypothetical protein ACFL3B_05275 [Gemmatimonadota bacterium]
MTDADLKKLERTTFRAAADTGLWDLLLASYLATFAIVLLLSGRLGDFWSSAILVPVCAGVYLIIRIIHTRVVLPRVGIIEVGSRRRTHLRRLSSIMLVVNLVAFALGIFAATRSAAGQDFPVPLVLSLTLLVGFSLAAFLLGIPRLFVYGVLVAGAPLVGEELFQRGYASHHGWPITFGVAAAIIFVSGLVRFWRILPRRMAGAEALPQEGSDE